MYLETAFLSSWFLVLALEFSFSFLLQVGFDHIGLSKIKHMNCVNTFFSFYESNTEINHHKYWNYLKQNNKYLSINSNFICCPRKTIFIIILIFCCFKKKLILCLALLFERIRVRKAQNQKGPYQKGPKWYSN